MKKGKRYIESAKLVDRSAQYAVADALDLAVKTASAKFDETVELHVKLGVDGRNADQQVRGVVVLPHGTGKTKKILVFAKGDNADIATKAGADFVGADSGNLISGNTFAGQVALSNQHAGDSGGNGTLFPAV